MTFHDTGGPAPAPHDFSPSAIMARARAHAAEQARRTAGKSTSGVDLSSAEILADIEAEIDRGEPAREFTPGVTPAALLADMARAIDGCRA